LPRSVTLSYASALKLKRAGARPSLWSVVVSLGVGERAVAEIPVPREPAVKYEEAEVWQISHEIVDCESGAIRHKCWKDGILLFDVIHNETNTYIDYPADLFTESNIKGEVENLTARTQEFALSFFYERIPRWFHDKVERGEVKL